MKTAFAFALVLIFALPRCVFGTPSKADLQANENAAVKILRADVALRQAYPLAPDAAATLDMALESSLNAEDEKIVAAADSPLVEFEHAASLEHCDWAMSFEDGPFTNTSHRGAVTELVAVAGLRARLRFHDGDNAGAVKDILSAMAGARDLSVDETIASVLIAYNLEKQLSDILARNLARLSTDQLKQLTRGLDALPRGSNIGSAFEAEKLHRNDLLSIAEAPNSSEELISELLKRVPMLRSNRALAAEIVDGCGGSVTGFVGCVRQQQAFYASWAPRFSLAPAEFEKIYERDIQSASTANPVIRHFTPSLPRLRWAQAYCETRRALLSAAIAVRLNGRAALRGLRDPYDGKPFSYVSIKGGFELKSHLIDRGTPISLVVALQ